MFQKSRRRNDSTKQRTLEFHLLTTSCWLLLFVYLLNLPITIQAARSSADMGICESWVNGKFVTIDCITGSNNFCCNREKVQVDNDTIKWSKGCCSEKEFVQQNRILFLTLIIFNVAMLLSMIMIILTSFSTIILTEKAAAE